MFVKDKMIEKMATRYGSPVRKLFEIETSFKELEFIRSTQKAGRNHDVTIYAVNGDIIVDKKAITENKVAVIAKHFYPEKLYRAPSGGLNPGESFEVGIAREMAEEIGCEIKLERFLLHTSLKFINSDKSDHVAWRSFVFLARIISGDFQFTDKHEIKEVRLADWSEFDLFSKIMRESEIGGLHYRAQLHEAVLSVL